MSNEQTPRGEDCDNHVWHRLRRPGPYGRLQRAEDAEKHWRKYWELMGAFNPDPRYRHIEPVKSEKFSYPMPDIMAAISKRFINNGERTHSMMVDMDRPAHGEYECPRCNKIGDMETMTREWRCVAPAKSFLQRELDRVAAR